MYLLLELEANKADSTKSSDLTQMTHQLKTNKEISDLKHDLNCLVLLVQRAIQHSNLDIESIEFKTIDLQNKIGFIKEEDIKTEENNTDDDTKNVKQDIQSVCDTDDGQTIDQLEMKKIKTEISDDEKCCEAPVQKTEDYIDILLKVSNLEKIIMLQQQRLIDSDNEKKLMEKMISQLKKDFKSKETEWNRREMVCYNFGIEVLSNIYKKNFKKSYK